MTTQPDHEASHERLEARVAGRDQRLSLVLDAINNLSERIELRFTALEERLNGIDRRLDRHDQRFDQLDQRTEDIARHLGVPKRNGRA